MRNTTLTPEPEVNLTLAPEVVDYNGFKLTVINDSNTMGIDKLHIRDFRAKDEGFDLAYVQADATVDFSPKSCKLQPALM